MRIWGWLPGWLAFRLRTVRVRRTVFHETGHLWTYLIIAEKRHFLDFPSSRYTWCWTRAAPTFLDQRFNFNFYCTPFRLFLTGSVIWYDQSTKTWHVVSLCSRSFLTVLQHFHPPCLQHTKLFNQHDPQTQTHKKSIETRPLRINLHCVGHLSFQPRRNLWVL